MKILILTANTGGGHNAAAKAIQEEARLRGITCDIKNFMAFTPKAKEIFVVDGHALAYRYLPNFYGIGYNLIDKNRKSGNQLFREYAKYAYPLKEYILEHGYDTVIAVHIFAALMLTKIRKTSALNIKQYLVITDYTCSPGAASCEMDAWFIPRGLRELFVEKGIDNEKIVESGIPCTKEVYGLIDHREARLQLGFQDEAPVIFLCAGNLGLSKIEGITKKLLGVMKESHLVILCGRNYSRMSSRRLFKNKQIQLIEKTGHMPLWMHGADVFITKAGGLTITEAAGARVPLVLFGAVPGLETQNRDFFLHHHCALGAEKKKELVEAVKTLVEKDALREEMIKNQSLVFPDISVQVLMNTVMKEGKV